MQLFVRGLQGHSTVINVHDSDTVAGLKLAVEASVGIPANELVLTANGRLLVDAEKLACTGLQPDSSVQLLLRLCGGKGGFGALLRGQGRDGKITDNFDACRDLSGRRIRHVEAEKKLQDWKKEQKERDLEQLALKHMKDLAQQAKRDRDYKINVEEVKREHKEAATAVVEAVQTALTEGLQQQQGKNSSSSKPGSTAAAGSSKSAEGAKAACAAAEAASPGSKRKASSAEPAGAGAADGSSPVKKRKVTMLDMVEGTDSDTSSSSDDSEDES